MQIADPAVGRAQNALPIFLDPAQVNQVVLTAQWLDQHGTGVGATGVIRHQQLNQRIVGATRQQRVGIGVGCQRPAVDRKHVVADVNVRANFCQRRAVFGFLGVPGENIGNTVTTALRVRRKSRA